ncbi:MAG: NFACT family protein, partial [Candidatus Thermoplasmatota archaeon]|nr:NFACT family protein [Candidatus Thermoplasmatota archaeon]
GNVILLDPEGVIIQPLTSTEYASRTLKRGANYEWPPSQVDPRELTEHVLSEILNSSDSDIVRTLAAKANLGRGYANAVCAKIGIDPNLPVKKLEKSQHTQILNELSNLLSGIDDSTAYAWVKDLESLEKIQNGVSAGDIPPFLEVAPVILSHLDSKLRIEYASLSSAADTWWGAHDAAAYARREMEKMIEAGDAEETVGSQLGRRAVQQEGAIESFQRKAEKTQTKAQAITDNYVHVDQILQQIRSAIEVKGWEEVRSSLKGIEWIESVNPADRTMMAYLPNEDGKPGERVELYVDESVHQNAQRYFATARTFKDKSKGAEKALEDTTRKQRKEEKQRAKDEAAGRVGKVKRSKRLWFEKHRWTILSDGRLMVGGRDARGNDTVVKKHLGKDDLYVHADLHGAPSCSVRIAEGFQDDSAPNPTLPEHVPSLRLNQSNELGEPSEEVLTEAAQIAICWSRAWGSGGGAATAFHVRST